MRHVGGAPDAHELAGLDRGEWEAIELAREITLGVLVEAARSGIVSIDEAPTLLAKRTGARVEGQAREARPTM